MKHKIVLSKNLFKEILKLPDQRSIMNAISAIDKFISNPFDRTLNLEKLLGSSKKLSSIRIKGQEARRLILKHESNRFIILFPGKHDEVYKKAEKINISNIDTENVIHVNEVDEKIDIPNFNQIDQEVRTINQEHIENLFSNVDIDDIKETGATQEEITFINSIKNEDEFLSEYSQNFLGDKLHKDLVHLYLGEKIPERLPKLTPNSIFSSEKDFENLMIALEKPWEKWLVFLDHSQSELVSANYNGSSKIFGGAGTGKTVIALHRAKYLIENMNDLKDDSVALLTFSRVLSNDIEQKADLLLGPNSEIRKKLKIGYLEEIALEIVKNHYSSNFHISNKHTIQSNLINLAKEMGATRNFSEKFILSEYENVIGPWSLWDFNKYKDFQRKGRITALKVEQRKELSELYSKFNEMCFNKNTFTPYHLYQISSDILKNKSPRYTHLIIDETQDLGPHILSFARKLVEKKPNDIMLCGDIGQSLYRRYHSYSKHGFEVRGNSRKLNINYRTSRQIKDAADKMNEFLIQDDDNFVERRSSLSIFNGPKPKIKFFQNREDEQKALIEWVKTIIEGGVQKHELVILARKNKFLNHIKSALVNSEIECWVLDDNSNYLSNQVGLALINRVKGLEYKAVAIFGCDEDQFPNEEDLQNCGDQSDQDNYLVIEKNLLYVAMTRAREELYISGIFPGSPFLSEIKF